MRKLFWCGVAVALVTAGGVHWLAARDGQCPCSVIVGCAKYLFGKAQPPAAQVAPPAPAGDVQLVPLGGFDANGLPILESDAEQTAKGLQWIDLPFLTANPPMKNGEEEEEPMAEVGGGQGDALESPMCGLSADPVPEAKLAPTDDSMEEPMDLSQIMQPCRDEDDLPDFMPYAEDTPPADAAFVEFFLGFFRPPAPAAKAGAEEAETPIPATKPECREDPNHHYQDAGCPFMSPCPAGRCPGAESIKVVPKLELEEQEQRMDQEAFRLLHRKLPCMLEPAAAEETPSHPEVDTMEFRPSDARQHAFENFRLRRPL